MIFTQRGNLNIVTGQEFEGESHRTSVFDTTSGMFLMNVHESDAATTQEEAQAQHDRYVEHWVREYPFAAAAK